MSFSSDRWVRDVNPHRLGDRTQAVECMVGGHQLSHVIRQEGAPGLRRWLSTTNHVLRDAGLADSHDDERASPVLPCARNPHPQDAVRARETQPLRARPFEH